MVTYVHRNLNRGCWSVLERGKLKGYRHRLAMRDVEFRVRPGGHKRAVREERRNVHAFAVGQVSTGIPAGRGTPVRYDIGSGKFVDRKGRHIVGAKRAYFDERGRVSAYRPTYAPIV